MGRIVENLNIETVLAPASVSATTDTTSGYVDASGAEEVREYDIAPDVGESYASPGSEDAPRSSGAGARRPGLVLGMLAALTARFPGG